MSKENWLDTDFVPFSIPSHGELENAYIQESLSGYHRHGAGRFTNRATILLQEITGARKVLLTQSCTGALEFAMLLAGIREGDEVILPSFTFSSTANAIVLRGATPVFADINSETQCLDPSSVEKIISEKTKAIVPVHYAGIGCDMESLSQIAKEHHLIIIEDAAQAIGAYRDNRHLGSFGALGALSFHDSKNISCGEGGALLINDERLIERAEILWEKGTDRSKFMRGEVDKYTWVDVGSSFLPSEVTAAFLLGQLERFEQINEARRQLWRTYYEGFAEAEALGVCRRPSVPDGCSHNGHIFYLILNSESVRADFLANLKSHGVSATFHYVPLHSSLAGMRYGRADCQLPNTEIAGCSLVRLPLYPDMTQLQQERVIRVANAFLYESASQGQILKVS